MKCKTFLKPKEINALVLRTKKRFNESDFNLIVDNTKRIYFKRIESYSRCKKFLSELDKDDIKNVYKSFIYNAICTFDESRMSSFTTYLHNLTNYMLYTLYTSEYKEERKKATEWVTSYYDKTRDKDSFLNEICEKEEHSFIMKKLERCVNRFHDKRIKKILDIRFNTYQHKNAPWREVAEQVGCSRQYCQFLLEQLLISLRKELKIHKNSYVIAK